MAEEVYNPDALAQRATRALKARFPELGSSPMWRSTLHHPWPGRHHR